MLEVKNLKKKFSNNLVLKDINLSIQEGERIVIIGPSGCGKSTLLRCLNGLNEITSGEIIYKGKNISKKETNKEEIRKKIGMVFQQFNLFPHLTVMENIILAPVKHKLMTKDEAIKKGKDFLEKINLLEKINSYPKELSGGEQQRVAIIRTLMMNPEVILFDEPTSALDPKMKQEVLELMKSLSDLNLTMIVVTHEMNFAYEFATRIIYMEDGIIVEEGTKEEIFNKPKSKNLKEFLKSVRE